MVTPEALRRIRQQDAKRRGHESLEDLWARIPCAECGQIPPCLHTSSDNQFPQHGPRRATQ